MKRAPKSLKAVVLPRAYEAFARVPDAARLEALWSAAPHAVLANLAHLAYHPPATITGLLRRLGAAEVSVLGRRGAAGFLAAWPDRAVLAFRGTVAADPRNLLADLDVRRARVGGARVHRGFLRIAEGLWEALAAPRLAALAGAPPAGVWATGHSLGGAIAALAGLRAPLEAVVTFGEPRLGAGIEAAFRARRHVRYVNGRDPVPRLPPPWLGYQHHGEAVVLRDPQGPSARYDHAIVYYAELLEMAAGAGAAT